MYQYLELLKAIINDGTSKSPAREGMPGSTSLFGYQFRHNLQNGFPLLTTKQMYWKGIVVELLWFLRGDTNIKYLVDRGVNIWNQDAYNFYVRKCRDENLRTLGFNDFIKCIKMAKSIEELAFDCTHNSAIESPLTPKGYILGDMGHQYGRTWRDFGGIRNNDIELIDYQGVDQICNVIKSLKETPEGRRHIVTAVDPLHDTPLDVALYWCHSMFQFNCRPIEFEKLWDQLEDRYDQQAGYNGAMAETVKDRTDLIEAAKEFNIPIYYLDCQLYQRSADSFLGVPFNIASYALLTHIMAKICNMVPGEFIHTFGDAHIYDNHKEAVYQQLMRSPQPLPKLEIAELDWNDIVQHNFETLIPDYFKIVDYNPYDKIEADLSTGLK